MCGHVPTPKGDQDDWNETADDAANGFGALGVELSAKSRTELTADQPAECAADNETENCEDRRANEQANIFTSDSRSDADSKEAANGADDSTGECAHVGFTKGGSAHKAKVSHKSYVSYK